MPPKSPPIRTFLAVALVLSALALPGPVRSAMAQETLVGDRRTISVIDGDTLQVGDRIVQLAGIDAPELGQVCIHDEQPGHCGLTAAYALGKLVNLAAAPIVCGDLSERPDGLVEASCESGAENLALNQLRSGYAVALPDATGFYREAAEGARKASLGLWGDQFVPPWDWRKGTRLAQEAQASDGPCPVRAQGGADGARIYWVPTDPDYEKIRVDPGRGDELFCSDEAARQAGWLRPGQPLSR